jgi:hypothetical protein
MVSSEVLHSSSLICRLIVAFYREVCAMVEFLRATAFIVMAVAVIAGTIATLLLS